MEEKIVSKCGIVCSECEAYKSWKNDDDELRKKTAEIWSKQFNGNIKPEHINCMSCQADDTKDDTIVFSHCMDCEIRACAKEKNVSTCAACDDYACEMLEKFLDMVPGIRENLEELR